MITLWWVISERASHDFSNANILLKMFVKEKEILLGADWFVPIIIKYELQYFPGSLLARNIRVWQLWGDPIMFYQ